MLSRKGSVLVMGGAFLITFGSLVFAAMWIAPLLTNARLYSTLTVQTDQGPLARWIEQHSAALYALAEASMWLGTGGAFFLGLAALRPGLNSLVRGLVSVPVGISRWLAILGLISVLLAVVGQGTFALVEQEWGVPLPDGIFVMLLKTPFLWPGLIGFCGILWGSFLRDKPGESQRRTDALKPTS